MFNFIKDFLEFRRKKNQRRIACKRFMIGQAMENYYKDLQGAKGETDIPPFLCAYKAMQELKTDKDVNKIYRKLEMAGLV